jgi:hypothetical protein
MKKKQVPWQPSKLDLGEDLTSDLDGSPGATPSASSLGVLIT